MTTSATVRVALAAAAVAAALCAAAAGTAPLASAASSATAAPPACNAASSSLDQAFSSDTIRIDYAWTPYAVRPASSVGGVAIAQTVTVGRSGTLVRVAIDARGRNLAGDLPLEIRGGGPDGPMLAGGSLGRSALEAGGWIDVPVAPAFPVAAGDVIAIVLPALAGIRDADVLSNQPRVTWVTSPGDSGYPGGSAFAGDRRGRASGVTSWGGFASDRQFRTYLCGPPETATDGPPPRSPTSLATLLGLVGAVLVGAGLMIRRLDDAGTGLDRGAAA